MKRQQKIRSMPKNKLPAIPNSAVWEKVMDRRGGVMWDNVVGKAWEEIEGDPEDNLSVEKLGGYKTELTEKGRKKERLAPKKVEGEEQ